MKLRRCVKVVPTLGNVNGKETGQNSEWAIGKVHADVHRKNGC